MQKRRNETNSYECHSGHRIFLKVQKLASFTITRSQPQDSHLLLSTILPSSHKTINYTRIRDISLLYQFK